MRMTLTGYGPVGRSERAARAIVDSRAETVRAGGSRRGHARELVCSGIVAA